MSAPPRPFPVPPTNFMAPAVGFVTEGLPYHMHAVPDHLGGHLGVPVAAEVQMLREQIEAQHRELQRLNATVAHFRGWAAALQARYAAFNPDAARPARRVYVGNLPADATEGGLRAALGEMLAAAGGAAGPGAPVAAIKLYSDKGYAFVELRSVEEASNAMALDGARLGEHHLKVRRPNNYDPAVALLLGPPEPSPGLDVSRLGAVRTVVPDSPHKLFLGGLPCDWPEAAVKELLAPFGPLRAFNLVMDRSTGNSKGYAFCELADVGATDAVVAALHGKSVGAKFLTVKRALAPPM